jgi:hypothetical protein
MSSVATSICLQNRGFPIDIINAIAAYATTGRWIFLYDNEGNFVRKLNLYGFDKISRNITTKVENYAFVTPHAVHYNALVFYPGAITHVHPPMQNENGVLMSRSYTSVEVAPEVFDYILINEMMDNKVGDWMPRNAYVFRPYCDHPIGRAQSIHRYHEDNNLNLTDIHFELWFDDWEWEPFHGIHIVDDIDDMMEEWANEWAQDDDQGPQEDDDPQYGDERQYDDEPQEDDGPQEDEYAGIGGDHAWWKDEDSYYDDSEWEEEEDEDEDEKEWNREQRMRGYV